LEPYGRRAAADRPLHAGRGARPGVRAVLEILHGVSCGVWVGDVLTFWFGEIKPQQWFKEDPAFEPRIREGFLGLHETLAARVQNELVTDPRGALAAVIVLDQFSRNMFRDPPRAFAADPQALGLAQAAIERGFEAALTKDERMFLYLPFEHSEDRAVQARS